MRRLQTSIGSTSSRVPCDTKRPGAPRRPPAANPDENAATWVNRSPLARPRESCAGSYSIWTAADGIRASTGRPDSIEAVLPAIKGERPNLRLHGFGLKLTALGNWFVRDTLESSDSMAWSFGAWKAGRSPNSWEEAMAYCQRVEERLAA